MAYNTPDELITFSKLTFEAITPAEVTTALNNAMLQVDFVSPLEDVPRSIRAHEIRKIAEANLATSFLWEIIAHRFALDLPDNRIIAALGFQVGADAPHAIDLQGALIRAATRYRDEGNRLLKMIKPVLATLRASKKAD